MKKGPTRTLFEAITASDQLVGVSNLFGAHELNKHRAPNSIVWVPVQDTFGVPMGYSGNFALNNPRPIWTREATIEVHIWGADPGGPAATWSDHMDATEDLLERTLQAIQQQKFTDFFYTARNGTWQNQNGELVRLGAMYVLLIDALLPVSMATSTEAIVNTYPISREFVLGDGSLEPDNG